MSELSEAERRKILRERRQKKFSNGGASSRLNKITGQTDSLLSNESPLDSRDGTPVAESISIKSASPAIIEEEKSLPNEQNPEVQLLKQLAAMQGEGSNSSPDLFSLLGAAKQGDASGSTPDLFSLLSAAKQGAAGDMNTEVEAPIDPALLNYHNYLVNKLKAWTIFIKWVFFLIPYVYVVTRGDRQSFITLPESLESLKDSSKFFMIFTAFEIVATSIYYQRLQTIEKENKVDTLDNNSKILKIVSMVPEGILPIKNIKGKVVTLLQYWDVLSMFITDVCFVLVIMGIMLNL